MGILWHESPTSVHELAMWLVERNDLDTASAVLDYFEKPWHYEYEWNEYCAEIDATILEHQAAES